MASSESSCDAKPPAQFLFEPVHLATIALVVIPEKMQHAMQHQYAQLPRKTPPILLRITPRRSRRNRNIPQIPRRDHLSAGLCSDALQSVMFLPSNLFLTLPLTLFLTQ